MALQLTNRQKETNRFRVTSQWFGFNEVLKKGVGILGLKDSLGFYT